MKRKVAQIGPSTLMVSLPTKWVKENNLSKGDELNVSLAKKKISFSLGEIKEKEKSITIDISDYMRYLLDREMTILYRNNYDKIVLTYNKTEFSDHNGNNYIIQNYIQKLSKRFIGVEIVSQTDKRTELACFILKDLENVKAIEKRIYFLLKETTTSLMEAIDKDFSEFDKVVYDHHDNIVKFINYYLRIIDRIPMDEGEKKQVYAFYVLIDKIVDKLRHLSRKIAKYGCSKRVQKYLQKTFNWFYDFFECFYRKNSDQDLISRRYELVNEADKTNYTADELRVITEVDLFLNLINEFTETILMKKLVQ